MVGVLVLVASMQLNAPPEDAFEAVYGPNWDWAVHAGPGGFSLTESEGDERSFRFFASPRITRTDNVTRLEARTAAGAPVALSIASEVCRSGGGSVYPYTARLEVDGAIRSGCAWGRVRYRADERLMLGDYDLASRIGAAGAGPAWEAQLGEGGPNRVTIDGATFVESGEALPTLAGGTAVYRLRGENGRTATATLRVRACTHGGRHMPFTVEVRAGNRRLNGCGRQTTHEVGPSLTPTMAPQMRKLAGTIEAADYPPAALRDGAGGRVMYEYAIDTGGRVTACAVRYSSGHRALDRATCSLVMGRFRYEPMRDRDGNPVEYVGMGSLTWRLPQE